jgi:small subunit ribosomal protein S6
MWKLMRNYELMTIAKANLSDDKAKTVFQEINDLIVTNKGVVDKTDPWGKRKFAYEIEGAKEGYYSVTLFQLEPANLSKLKDKLKLNESLVRYLVTTRMSGDKVKAKVSPKTSKKEEKAEE